MKHLAISITAISLIALPCAANAESINLEQACSDSGSVTITGSYEVTSGAVDFTLATKDCVQNGYAIDGTGSVKGTFKMAGDPTSFNTDITTIMEATFTKDANSVDATFTNTMKGSYDIVTSELNGTVTNSVSSTGKIKVDIMELMTVDWSGVAG